MDKVGQKEEAWVLGMEQYFKIHDYSKKEKAWISIFSLNGQALIWWENLLEVKGIKERKANWDKLWKYVKEKYLSARYYDNKRKEFHELKLGYNSMEEHVQKVIELLRYVRYIKEERVKIQSLLGGIPLSYRDMIEFSNPQTIEEAIRMVMHCYK